MGWIVAGYALTIVVAFVILSRIQARKGLFWPTMGAIERTLFTLLFAALWPLVLTVVVVAAAVAATVDGIVWVFRRLSGDKTPNFVKPAEDGRTPELVKAAEEDK